MCIWLGKGARGSFSQLNYIGIGKGAIGRALAYSIYIEVGKGARGLSNSIYKKRNLTPSTFVKYTITLMTISCFK